MKRAMMLFSRLPSDRHDLTDIAGRPDVREVLEWALAGPGRRRRLLRAVGLGGHDRLTIALRGTVEWQRVRIEDLEARLQALEYLGAVLQAQVRPRPWLGGDERPVLLLGTGGGGTRVLGEAALRLGVILGRRVNETFDSIEWVSLVYGMVLNDVDGDARARVLAQAQAIHAPLVTEGGRWGIKLPELMMTLPPFLAAFPAAQAVLLLRHPLAASLRRHHLTSTLDHPLGRAVLDQGYRALGLDPARARTDGQHLLNAVAWIHQITQARRVLAALPAGQVLQLWLEDFAAAPAGTNDRLADFLGRPVPGVGSLVRLDPLRLESWRQAAGARDGRAAEVLALCGPLARELGCDV